VNLAASRILKKDAVAVFPRRKNTLCPILLVRAESFDSPGDLSGRVPELRGVGELDDLLGQL
jgi:hypothetical protein